jgi:hypothetical protein
MQITSPRALVEISIDRLEAYLLEEEHAEEHADHPIERHPDTQ